MVSKQPNGRNMVKIRCHAKGAPMDITHMGCSAHGFRSKRNRANDINPAYPKIQPKKIGLR